MSEASNSWRFELDGRQHEVQLDHGTISGRRAISVDGAVVVEDSKFFDTGSRHELEVAGHRVEVRIDVVRSGFAHESSLHLDGSYVEPLRR